MLFFLPSASTLPNENIPLIMRIPSVFFSFLPLSVKKISKNNPCAQKSFSLPLCNFIDELSVSAFFFCTYSDDTFFGQDDIYLPNVEVLHPCFIPFYSG